MAGTFPAGLGLTGPYLTAAELRARYPHGLRMLAADTPPADVPPAGRGDADDDHRPEGPGPDGRLASIGMDQPAAHNGNGHGQNGSSRPGEPGEQDSEGFRPLSADDRNSDDGPRESQPAPLDDPPGPADSQPAARDYSRGTPDYRPVPPDYSPGLRDYRPAATDYRVFPQDRPAHGSLDDMRRRLELLPAGHPSSPYEDDGSRKPAPPRLRHLELPLSDDERDGQARSWRTASASPDAGGNGGATEALWPTADWMMSQNGLSSAEAENWNGSAPPDPAAAADFAPGRDEASSQAGGPADAEPEASQPAADAREPHATRLTTEQQQIAEQALTRFRTAEGRNVFGSYGASGITPAIRRVAAQLPSGGLAPGSDQNTLKHPERFRYKLAGLIARNPDVPAEQLVTGIYDAIRYAFTFEPADYTDGTWLVHRRLKAQGFELEVRRNRWDTPESKGIRTQWRDPAHDLPFEVQFHTTASWDVLQRTHRSYLMITDPATPPADRARLRTRQVAAATAAPPPPRCAEIADFRIAHR